MKKRIISMMLSVALVITTVPSASVNATETAIEPETAESDIEIKETVENASETQEATETTEPETETEDIIETTESETETEEVIESDILLTEELKVSSEEYKAFNVSADGKVIGSNGVVYEDVVYLSVATLKSFDENIQRNYISVCDQIASWAEAGREMQDVVIAVDEEGTIHWSVGIPAIQLQKISNEMQEEAMNSYETEEIEDISETESVKEESETAEEATEVITEEATETGVVEETVEEATETEVAEETVEEVIETEVAEETVEEATETEVAEETVEEITEETEVVEETVEEITEETTETEVIEETTEETVEETTEEISEIEAEEEESEEITEELFETQETDSVARVENMDKLPAIVEETFEVAEDIKVERLFDFGYDSEETMAQLNAKLPSTNFFYGQLSSYGKNMFNAAKSSFTSGKNVAKYKGPSSFIDSVIWEDACEAFCAIVLTYPQKMDWYDRTKILNVQGKKYYSGSCDITITVPKSKYYTNELVQQSNAKVKQLAVAAQEYALKNYPQKPVYGVVKYFDKWICENNYYNDTAGINPNTTKQDVYHYCHSSFGILLKGYGVCESYALAMTRLLDALSIPNVYVLGYVHESDQGHAWNNVKMPDGKWYLLDSTWNDTGSSSSRKYLLCADDGAAHTATGAIFSNCDKFKFVKLEKTKYVDDAEIDFNKKEYDLIAKQTLQLTEDIKYKTTWKSSNTKVVKVSNKGKVTAVGPGTATVTMKTVGITASCTVNVHRINSITFNDNNKTSYSFTQGVPDKKFPKSTFYLTTNQIEGHEITAEKLVSKKMYEKPEVTSSKEDVATAAVKLSKDKITLTVTPKSKGTSKIIVKFAGKTAILNYTVKQEMSSKWFVVEKYNKNAVDYTGKEYKPSVTVSDKAPADLKKSDFKIVHKNNKNAGTAQVIVSGKGKIYGGDIVLYEYKIKPIDIKDAEFTLKNTSKIFNGGEQNPTAVVEINVNGKLKKLSSKDITFSYKISGKTATSAINAGIYNVIINGTGNYTGKIDTKQAFEIKETTIDKLSVKLAKTKLDYTGKNIEPEVSVKIGKNVIDTKNYTITYRKTNVNGGIIKNPKDMGKYVAVITVKGKNIKPTAKKTEIVKSFTIK